MLANRRPEWRFRPKSMTAANSVAASLSILIAWEERYCSSCAALHILSEAIAEWAGFEHHTIC